jgi:hypothetical protein
MACAIIGAYRHNHRRINYQLGTHSGFLEGADGEEIGKLIKWGKLLCQSQDRIPLRYLLRRHDFIPADRLLMFRQWWGALTPESLRSTFSHPAFTQYQYWEPQDDYTHFFLRAHTSRDLSLHITTLLRWRACVGALHMDSNANIMVSPNSTPELQCGGAEREGQVRGLACIVESTQLTEESEHAAMQSTVQLQTLLEAWHTDTLTGRLFPEALLPTLVEYTVSRHLKLVIWSTCQHLREQCHFGELRFVWIDIDTDVCDILYAFLHVNECEFALSATDTEGKVHDFSVVSRLPARALPMTMDVWPCGREIRLQVRANVEYYHECASCGDRFRCIFGYSRPRPTRDIPLPDLRQGCECHHLESSDEAPEWFCSNTCFYG